MHLCLKIGEGTVIKTITPPVILTKVRIQKKPLIQTKIAYGENNVEDPPTLKLRRDEERVLEIVVLPMFTLRSLGKGGLGGNKYFFYQSG